MLGGVSTQLRMILKTFHGVLLPALVYINLLILRVNTLAHSLVVLMMMLPMAISKMVTRCLQIKSK
jgi:hypothetical protein